MIKVNQLIVITVYKFIRSRIMQRLYLTYLAVAGEDGVEPRYEDKNIWLTQKMLSVLYMVYQHLQLINI